MDEENAFVWATIVACFAFLAFTCLWRLHLNQTLNKKYSLPPYARVGLLEFIGLFGTDAPLIVLDLARRTSGDIFRVFFPFYGGLYVLKTPAVMKTILQDATTDKPRLFYSDFDKITGMPSILSRPTDKIWKMKRKGALPAFSKGELHRMIQTSKKHVNQWIDETLHPCIEQGEPFDPSLEMCRITFKVIIEAAFEYECTDQEYEDFKHHLDISIKAFLAAQSLIPLRKYFGLLSSSYRNGLKSAAAVRAFSRKLLDSYRKNDNKSESKTFIRLLVENEGYASDEERIADIGLMITAGFDTTGFSIGTTLLLLAKHPEICEKLRAELLSMEECDRNNCKYLKDVIMESTRLIPVSGFTPMRQTGRDFYFENHVMIPKGSIVFPAILLGNRNERVFTKPDEFNPDRWDQHRDWTNLLFTLGPRACLGISLANAELYSTLSKLISDYKFDVQEEGKLTYFLTWKFEGALLKASKV